jgi:hypothetical protein
MRLSNHLVVARITELQLQQLQHLQHFMGGGRAVHGEMTPTGAPNPADTAAVSDKL